MNRRLSSKRKGKATLGGMDNRFKELEVTGEHGTFGKRRMSATGGSGRREDSGEMRTGSSAGGPRRLYAAPRVTLSCSDPSGYCFNLKGPFHL